MLKRLALNTAVQTLGRAIMVGVALLTTGVLTRKLGVVGYGNFLLIGSLGVFFDTLADFGTTIMGVREASKEESETGKRKVWSSVAVLRLQMALISFSLAVTVTFLWPDFATIRIEAILAWLMLLFTSVAGSLGIVWQTRLRMEKKVVAEVMFPGLFLVALWLHQGEISLLWVFGIYLLARIISLGYAWYVARGSISFKERDKELIKKILRLSWPMGVYLLIFSAYDRAADSLMIRRMLGENEVAWYGLAYKIYAVLVQPAYFLVSGVFPTLSAKKETKKVFELTAGLLLIAVGLVISVSWILAPWIIKVLAGEGYEMAAVVLRILVFALLFSYLGHLVGFTLIAKEGQEEMSKLSLLVLVFNLVANLIFIPVFGLKGAAGVTVATEALSLCFMSWKLRQKTNLK